MLSLAQSYWWSRKWLSCFITLFSFQFSDSHNGKVHVCVHGVLVHIRRLSHQSCWSSEEYSKHNRRRLALADLQQWCIWNFWWSRRRGQIRLERSIRQLIINNYHQELSASVHLRRWIGTSSRIHQCNVGSRYTTLDIWKFGILLSDKYDPCFPVLLHACL